jgi:hypothetical protein
LKKKTQIGVAANVPSALNLPQKTSAYFVLVELCLQHSNNGINNSWMNCIQEILFVCGLSNISHVQYKLQKTRVPPTVQNTPDKSLKKV